MAIETIFICSKTGQLVDPVLVYFNTNQYLNSSSFSHLEINELNVKKVVKILKKKENL